MVEIRHKQKMMQRDWDMSRFGGDSISHGRKPLDAFGPCMLVGEHSWTRSLQVHFIILKTYLALPLVGKKSLLHF